MKGIHFSAILAVLLLSLTVASASAAGYDPHDPIVVPHNTQPPVLLTPGCQLAQQLCLLYPDGTNVTLAQPPRMKVRACSLEPNGQCVTFEVNLVNGTTPCNYAYRINATTLGLPVGQIKLYIIAGSMTDKLGHAFPSTDTAIGTVTLTAACSLPSTTSQGNCGNVTSTSKPPGTNCTETSTITSTPPTSTIPSLAREVQPPVESTNPNPASPSQQQSQTAVKSQPGIILAVLGVLVFAGVFMTLRQRKH